jgi:hypothetical protein
MYWPENKPQLHPDSVLIKVRGGWCGILITAGTRVILFSILFSLALGPTQLEVPSWAQSSCGMILIILFPSGAEVMPLCHRQG